MPVVSLDRSHRKLVILDRDGTVVKDAGQTNKQDELEWLPGIVPFLGWLVESNFSIAIASNQAGVAKGLFSVSDVLDFNFAMHEDLRRQIGYSFDAIVFCPHHPTDRCGCRKPNTGLITLLANMGVGNPVLMLGDSSSDLECAYNFGIPGILVSKNLQFIQDAKDFLTSL